MSKNKKVVIITGASRSGKDTLAAGLRLPIVKFAAPAKRSFEEWLDLPRGFLDSPDRSNPVKHPVTGQPCGYTYLDLLVNAYHVWDNICPDGIMLPLVEKTWQPYPVFCITDLRKQYELDLILARFNLDDILHLRVEGRGTVLSSDGFLETTEYAFRRTTVLSNTSTLEAFQKEIRFTRGLVNRFINKQD